MPGEEHHSDEEHHFDNESAASQQSDDEDNKVKLTFYQRQLIVSYFCNKELCTFAEYCNKHESWLGAEASATRRKAQHFKSDFQSRCYRNSDKFRAKLQWYSISPTGEIAEGSRTPPLKSRRWPSTKKQTPPPKKSPPPKNNTPPKNTNPMMSSSCKSTPSCKGGFRSPPPSYIDSDEESDDDSTGSLDGTYPRADPSGEGPLPEDYPEEKDPDRRSGDCKSVPLLLVLCVRLIVLISLCQRGGLARRRTFNLPLDLYLVLIVIWTVLLSVAFDTARQVAHAFVFDHATLSCWISGIETATATP